MKTRKEILKAIQQWERETGFEFMYHKHSVENSTDYELIDDMKINIDWLRNWTQECERCFAGFSNE